VTLTASGELDGQATYRNKRTWTPRFWQTYQEARRVAEQYLQELLDLDYAVPSRYADWEQSFWKLWLEQTSELHAWPGDISLDLRVTQLGVECLVHAVYLTISPQTMQSEEEEPNEQRDARFTGFRVTPSQSGYPQSQSGRPEYERERERSERGDPLSALDRDLQSLGMGS